MDRVNHTKDTFFDEANGHLNMAGRMLYAEAMELNHLDNLPAAVYQHVQNCHECSTQIWMLNNLMEGELAEMEEAHPFFEVEESDIELGDFSLSDNPMDIDSFLEQIKAEAIEVPLYEKMIEQQLAAAYRSSSKSIQLISPTHEQVCEKEVVFTFQKPTSSPLFLVLENHTGEVHDCKIPTNTTNYTVSLEPANQFPTGVYYWKLAGKGGKRMVGKFYIYQH